MINYQQTLFLKSAAKLSQLLPDNVAEIAFAGRSNAGKSSCLNALTKRNLARTSRTPGRTQLINYFSLSEPDRYLVDLPGYGYAKVPVQLKAEWDIFLGQYLATRQSLRGIILIMDIRHPFMPFDEQLLDWIYPRGLPVHILLNKADKLSRGAQMSALKQVQKHLQQHYVAEPYTAQCFSALRKVGVEEAEQVLNQWLE